MACVSVLIGQCGNQLGSQIYEAIATEAVRSDNEDYQSAISRHFFREPSSSGAAAGGVVLPETRSVLVDMEPKVIYDSIAKARRLGLFSVSPNQCVAREEGSANNWAYGYSQQGESRREAIADNVRKEAEEGGAVECFQIIHSLAGGTGSGVGSLTSEIIRDAFPHSTIMHTAVLPFSHGEVITQWYNLIFSLGYVNETADAVTLLANDDFSRTISQAALNVPSSSASATSSSAVVGGAAPRGGRGSGGPTAGATSDKKAQSGAVPATSLHDINELMGDAIASLWLPSSLLRTPDAVVKNTKVGGGGLGSSPQPSRQLHRPPSSSSSHYSAAYAASSSYTYNPIIRPAAITDIVEFVACDPRQKLLQASCFPAYGRALASAYKNGTWPGAVGAAMRQRGLHGSGRYLLSLRGAEAFTPPPPSHSSAMLLGSHCLSSGAGGQQQQQSSNRAGNSAAYHCNFTGAAEVGHLMASCGGGIGGAAPPPDALHASNVPFRGERAFVSLFDTSRTIGHRIAYAAHKAERMFSVNAFTHHFHRFGAEDDQFRAALLNAWHLARGYGDDGEGLSDDDEFYSSDGVGENGFEQ